jgi:hypothetical protein
VKECKPLVLRREQGPTIGVRVEISVSSDAHFSGVMARGAERSPEKSSVAVWTWWGGQGLDFGGRGVRWK